MQILQKKRDSENQNKKLIFSLTGADIEVSLGQVWYAGMGGGGGKSELCPFPPITTYLALNLFRPKNWVSIQFYKQNPTKIFDLEPNWALNIKTKKPVCLESAKIIEVKGWHSL